MIVGCCKVPAKSLSAMADSKVLRHEGLGSKGRFKGSQVECRRQGPQSPQEQPKVSIPSVWTGENKRLDPGSKLRPISK